jgi:hypothetical protein
MIEDLVSKRAYPDHYSTCACASCRAYRAEISRRETMKAAVERAMPTVTPEAFKATVKAAVERAVMNTTKVAAVEDSIAPPREDNSLPYSRTSADELRHVRALVWRALKACPDLEIMDSPHNELRIKHCVGPEQRLCYTTFTIRSEF